jgi:hypothetical protein
MPPEALIVGDGVTRRALGSEVGELRAESGSIAEADQHDRVLKTKISLDDLAPKGVAEQRREGTARQVARTGAPADRVPGCLVPLDP